MFDKMSAPTSLTVMTATSKEQQQQLIDNLYADTFKSAPNSIELTGLKQQLLISSSSHKKHDTSRCKNLDLIDTKFNELARKIIDELRQAHYAREFFRALDEIIAEPTRPLIHLDRAASAHSDNNGGKRRIKYRGNNLGGLTNSIASRQQQQVKDQHKENRVVEPQQPRSLPVEVAATQRPQQQQQQQQQLHQQQQHQPQPQSPYRISHQSSSPQQQQQKLRSAIPTSTIHSTLHNLQRNASVSDNQSQSGARSYPLGKSATVADATSQAGTASSNTSTSLKAQSGLKKSSSGSVQENIKQQQQRSAFVDAASFRRQTNKRDIDSDDEDDDDDDDDDDTDTGITYGVERKSLGANHRQAPFGQVARSKTKSDISSETINGHDKLQASLSPQSSVQKQRQHLNPIVRSHTISNSTQHSLSPSAALVSSKRTPSRNNDSPNQTPDSSRQEPKPMFLSGKDAAQLYKPHMNYSTSVLGNHRLSDDDEIIIIPTQSPSLVSTSPDNDAYADELTERFSISRTKSFWEKLSKGGNGKRAAKSAMQNAHSNDNDSNYVATTNLAFDPKTYPGQANKQTVGAHFSGHGNSQTLDRMDSTGGSNSNYSCSSSGDENCSNTLPNQNPTIAKLQEMSRQNRLRQTR